MNDPRFDRLLENMAKGHRSERKDRVWRGWLLERKDADLIDQAAAKRNVSRNAFLKRAALSMAAAVLDLDYAEVMEGQPAIRTFFTAPIESKGTTFDQHRVIRGSENGKGAGPWEIVGLK